LDSGSGVLPPVGPTKDVEEVRQTGERRTLESRSTEEQIIGLIKQAVAGWPIKELCRKGGLSDTTFYKWRAKCGSMNVADAE